MWRPALLALCLLGACGFELYGTSASYSIYADNEIAVTMPEGAANISQQFATRHPVSGYSHFGIDIWGSRGTPIIAAAPGTVIRSFLAVGHGNRVLINHGRDVEGQLLLSEYKHLDSRHVHVGDVVSRGQQIGTMGSKGVAGLLVHLHFEVQRGPNLAKAKPLDPHLFWLGGVGKVTCFDPESQQKSDGFATTYPVPCRSN